jgi:hypothetical protein
MVGKMQPLTDLNPSDRHFLAAYLISKSPLRKSDTILEIREGISVTNVFLSSLNRIRNINPLTAVLNLSFDYFCYLSVLYTFYKYLNTLL